MPSRDDAFSDLPWSPPDEVTPAPHARPRYRPPVGIPAPIPEAPTWRGTIASILLHALIVALIVAPIAAPALIPELMQQGAGGPGPAGGGGGGRGGTGGEDIDERLRYIDLEPTPVATPSIIPPVEEKKEEEKKPEEQKPAVPQVDIRTDVKMPDVVGSVVRGVGGGTGNDGSGGSGPGSGGGVGSGVGTGRGSSVGPGTGGGPGTVYPPSPVSMVMPPFELAQKYRPYVARAYFDVDERGNATLIAIAPPSRDRDYNRKLRERMMEYRFRPAVRWDGVPVRDTAAVTIEVP